MAKLSTAQVEKIAGLAKIKLSAAELAKFSKQLTAITDFVDQLKEVELPEQHQYDFSAALGEQQLRSDEPRDGLNEEQTFKNAQNRSQKNYFVTSKIL